MPQKDGLEHPGLYLRRVREEMGISQQALADKLGVSVQSVSSWETARYEMPSAQIESLDILYLAWQWENRSHLQSCEGCGASLQPPGVWLGYSDLGVPLVKIACGSCGRSHITQLATSASVILTQASKFPPRRGEYFVAKRAGDGIVVSGVCICCPICCTLTSLNDALHRITNDGGVTPSIICPNGCGFHTYVKLSKWE